MRPATVHPYGRQGASLYDLPTLRSQNTGSAAENTERLTGNPVKATVFSVRVTGAPAHRRQSDKRQPSGQTRTGTPRAA